MKVSMLGTLPPLISISLYSSNLLKAVCKHEKVEFIGFDSIYPEFLYKCSTKDVNSKEISIENAEIRNILNWYNPFSWLKAALTFKGDIMHLQWWTNPLVPVYLSILFFSKLRGKKTIVTVHDVLPQDNQISKRLFNRIVITFAKIVGSNFIVHSSRNKDLLKRLYKIDDDRVHVIPHGVLLSESCESVSKEKAREYLGIDHDKKILLYFGTIREYKGLDNLLKSFVSVKNKFPNSMLLIAGRLLKNWDVYQNIIDTNGLNESVKYNLGYIPDSDMKYYFCASDLVVLPYTHFESQSGIGAISLAYKKPLIVSDVGSLPDYVKNEICVFEPSDINQLSEKIIKILGDNHLLDQLSKDSEELAKEYGWDVVGEKTIELYNKILNEV